MSETYVLVHGAWHTGAEMEPTAAQLRAAGHVVHCPTLAGNRPGDDRSTIGLEEAIASLVAFVEQHDLQHIRLVGHSYGGMVISGAAERLSPRVRRLVYVNAFVPLDGECLNDLVPAHYVQMFDAVAAANGNAVMLPFPVWREAFINDADLALATESFGTLNPHPYRTFTDPARLPHPLAELTVGKSYVNCRQDTALPHSLGWHPRLSERLGLFRLVECDGSHETWFTNPPVLAAAILAAGRD